MSLQDIRGFSEAEMGLQPDLLSGQKDNETKEPSEIIQKEPSGITVEKGAKKGKEGPAISLDLEGIVPRNEMKGKLFAKRRELMDKAVEMVAKVEEAKERILDLLADNSTKDQKLPENLQSYFASYIKQLDRVSSRNGRAFINDVTLWDTTSQALDKLMNTIERIKTASGNSEEWQKLMNTVPNYIRNTTQGEQLFWHFGSMGEMGHVPSWDALAKRELG